MTHTSISLKQPNLSSNDTLGQAATFITLWLVMATVITLVAYRFLCYSLRVLYIRVYVQVDIVSCRPSDLLDEKERSLTLQWSGR